MKQYDIVLYGAQPAVLIETDLLPPDPNVVAIPLMTDYPAVTHLNPTIRFHDVNHILATRLVTSVRRSVLKPSGENAMAHRDEIIRAVDVLMGGF